MAEVGTTITFPEMAHFVFGDWTNGEGQVVTTVPEGTVQLSPKDIDIDLDKDGSGNYQIADEDDLKTLQAFVAAGFDCSGKTFKQTENIDMDGLLWTGIGNKAGTLYFAGIYDGNGKKIENVTFDAAQKSYMGFFRYVKNGTIKDLTVETDGFWNVPEFFGSSTEYGGAAIVGIAVNSTLSGLTANGQLGTQADPLSHNGGGICVEMMNGTIENCTNNVNVYCAYSKTAGICVFTRANGDAKLVTIQNCVNYGNFTGITCYTNESGRVNKGEAGALPYKSVASDGFAGIISWTGNDADQQHIVKNCENWGTITVDADATGAYLGGIFGKLSGAIEGEGNKCNAALPIVAIPDVKAWTNFWYESINDNVATQDKTALAAGQTRVIAAGAGAVANLPKPVLELAAGEDITFITNLCVTALDFSGITVADGAKRDEAVVAGGVKFTATALPPPGPTPDPKKKDCEIQKEQDGSYTVTPKAGSTTVTITGAQDGDVFNVEAVADVKITVNAGTVNAMVGGCNINDFIKGGTPVDTALDDAKVKEVVDKKDGMAFTAGESKSLTVNAIPGLTYRLMEGDDVSKALDNQAAKVTCGAGDKTVTLEDKADRGAKAFYTIKVTKSAE